MSLAQWRLGKSSVIVTEGLPYECDSRDPAVTSVIAGFADRKRLRKESSPHIKDKEDNPLCALPGTPGIGKSSFLRHFPYTQQYENYLRKHFPNNPLPIVVPVTFNSVMQDHRTADSFPARMLYGAATELFLGLGLPEAMAWKMFFKTYRNLCEEGDDAIELLLQTFG